MAYEPARRHRPRPVIRQAWLYCLLLALPALALAALLIAQNHIRTSGAILLIGGLAVSLYLVAFALIETMVRPVQTLSNVVSSLLEGDYSFRARCSGSGDAFGELAAEINALADLLQKQRVRSLEATALLARILEVMQAPLYAFDRQCVLRLVNDAGARLLGLPLARCYGRTATELHLNPLLDAPDQSMHSLGPASARWLLRKASFRQDGVPHTLLLLADVSQPLQQEEKAAWARLVRVLGHEISNSLTPIKSIAGSLLSRAESIAGEPEALHHLRRGLGVIESRADALHRFVRSYRALAQLPPPQLKSLQVRPLLDHIVLLEQRVPVQLDAGPDAHLLADSDQLQQMLINLLANAADASLANGAKPVRVTWHIENRNLVITIQDHGLGIANPQNLFVPFYTTKPNGSGVGLALAQQIAQAHQGAVHLVNADPGPGACAIVRLPLEQ